MVNLKGDPTTKDKIDERKKAFEAKYHRDEELAFKAGMRRAKLFGRVMAERLALAGAAADDYVRGMVEIAVLDPKPEALTTRAAEDCRHHGVAFDEGDLSSEVARCAALAWQQIEEEVANGTLTLSR